jgi:hypothetical protein
VSFIVTFVDCIVADISVTTPMATSATYIIGDTATVITLAVYT